MNRITDDICSNLEIDLTIPQGLRWVKKPNRNILVGTPCGGIDSKGYYQTKIDGVTYLNHRIIHYMQTGGQPEVVDHIFGDTLDNLHLRTATVSQNNANRRMHSNNTSGFKGVLFDKAKSKWRGQVSFNKKIFRTVYCNTAEEANILLRPLREQVHGVFNNHG